MNKHSIIVEGLIGAGKSTYTKELCDVLGPGTLHLDEPDEKGGLNPYLGDFYTNTDRWAFTMQVHLLSLRYRMQMQAQWHALSGIGHAVNDRSFFGDSCFARMLHKSGSISDREMETYRHMYQNMTTNILLPRICIHLQTDPETSLLRIQKRMFERTGRVVESGIDITYLSNLNAEIQATIQTLSKSGVEVIAVDWNHFRNKEERLEKITETVSVINSISANNSYDIYHKRLL